MSKRVAVAVATFVVVMSCGLLPPLVNTVRARAAREECKNNLRVVGGLLRLVDPESYPAGTIFAAGLAPEKRLSWYTSLLAPLGRNDLADSLDRNGGWEAGTNTKSRQTTFLQFLCPSARLARDSSIGLTDFVGSGGFGVEAPTLPIDRAGAGAFRYDTPTPLAAFKDGTSNTLLLLETADAPGPWIAGGRPTVRPLDPGRTPYLGHGAPFGGLHLNGCNVAFADWSSRFLSDTTAPDVLELLARIADG